LSFIKQPKQQIIFMNVGQEEHLVKYSNFARCSSTICYLLKAGLQYAFCLLVLRLVFESFQVATDL
jgi:predicted nucleic acid-binding Zn finger protein